MSVLDLTDETAWARWRSGKQLPSEARARKLLELAFSNPSFVSRLGDESEDDFTSACQLLSALDPLIADRVAELVASKRQQLKRIQEALSVVESLVPDAVQPMTLAADKLMAWIRRFENGDPITLAEAYERTVTSGYLNELQELR